MQSLTASAYGKMGGRSVSRPWELVAGDITGPFPRSTQGYECALVFVDLVTRWVEVSPIRKANAKTIFKELHERVIMRFGIPEVFLSDNSTEFKNQAVDQCLAEREVLHELTPVYCPRANLTERYYRALKTVITSYIQVNHRPSDKNLTELMFALSTAVHSTTNQSPAMLNSGRQPVRPGTLRRSLDREAAEEDELRHQWAERIEQQYLC